MALSLQCHAGTDVRSTKGLVLVLFDLLFLDGEDLTDEVSTCQISWAAVSSFRERRSNWPGRTGRFRFPPDQRATRFSTGSPRQKRDRLSKMKRCFSMKASRVPAATCGISTTFGMA
jgi:hypothetical protein